MEDCPTSHDFCHLLPHQLIFSGNLYIANNMDPDQTAQGS